jgi:AcrR family transcriptional regulator
MHDTESINATLGVVSARPQRLEYVDQTRSALLEAAERQFVADGYRATSQDAIAAEARFTKGALYRHFANKQAVFVAVLERVQRDAVDALAAGFAAGGAPTWDDAMAAVAAYLDLTTAERFRRIVLEEAPGVLGWKRWRELDEQFTGSVVRGLIEQLDAARVITVSDPALTARLVCALVAEAALGLSSAEEPGEARAGVLAALEQLLSGARAAHDS